MKRYFFIALALFVWSGNVTAQYVTIPDVNFRDYLKGSFPECFNASNQMDTTCFYVLTHDNVYLYDYGISSLDGIQYLKNLTDLYVFVFNNAPLNSIPKLPKKIKNISLLGTSLTSLPSLPDSLLTLDCYASFLIGSLPALPPKLNKLIINSELTALPALPASMRHLDCGSNNLTTLPFLPDGLTYLNCSSNDLTALTNLPNSLQELICDKNEIIALPSLPNSLTKLDCDRNYITTIPNFSASLQYIDCSYNLLSSLPALSNNTKTLNCRNNPLNCLPPLPFNLETLRILNTNVSCLPNVINGSASIDVSLPICASSSSICAVSAMAKGSIYHDANTNGVFDSLIEQLIPHQLVKVSPSNWISGSDMNGVYLIKLDTATNNMFSCINNHRYATINPTSYSLNNIHSLELAPGNYDFGIQLLPNIKDLSIAIGASPTRPGFNTNVTFTAGNTGTVNQSNTIIKFKKPNELTVVSSSPAASYISGDTLVWNNVSLDLFEHKSFTIQLHTPPTTPLSTPIAYEAGINGTQGDSTPADNYDLWKDLVRGSFDPNDKLVNKNTLPPTYNANTDRLLYTIRFQNTGTDTAFTVIVRDSIPANLEVSSLQVVNASHPYHLIVRDKNIVEVVFPNIQLPDSNVNEPRSHGFVQLSFKPKAGLPVNAEINNKAGIYFDYNAPVITNTAQTIVKIITGTVSNKKLDFKVFPNPASEMVQVELPKAGIGHWTLYNISGTMINQSKLVDQTFQISTGQLAAGTYLLSIEMDGQISSSRIIIVR